MPDADLRVDGFVIRFSHQLLIVACSRDFSLNALRDLCAGSAASALKEHLPPHNGLFQRRVRKAGAEIAEKFVGWASPTDSREMVGDAHPTKSLRDIIRISLLAADAGAYQIEIPAIMAGRSINIGSSPRIQRNLFEVRLPVRQIAGILPERRNIFRRGRISPVVAFEIVEALCKRMNIRPRFSQSSLK